MKKFPVRHWKNIRQAFVNYVRHRQGVYALYRRGKLYYPALFMKCAGAMALIPLRGMPMITAALTPLETEGQNPMNCTHDVGAVARARCACFDLFVNNAGYPTKSKKPLTTAVNPASAGLDLKDGMNVVRYLFNGESSAVIHRRIIACQDGVDDTKRIFCSPSKPPRNVGRRIQ